MQKRGGGFPWKWWIVCIFEKKNTNIIIALWFRMILVLLLEVQVHGSTWNQIFKILFRLLNPSLEDFWFQLCVPNLMPIFSVLMDWKTVVIYIFFSIFQNGKQSINFTTTKNICLLPSWTWTPMLCYEIYYLQKILAFFVRWLLVVSVVSPVYIVSSHSVIAILLSPLPPPLLSIYAVYYNTSKKQRGVVY